MSATNKALSRRWFEEVWNEQNTATIEELLRHDCIGHLEAGDVPGVEPFKQLHGEFLAAFPDVKIISLPAMGWAADAAGTIVNDQLLANPDIDLKFIRDSNGAITARLLAEKANPRADVLLGVAASSMEVFKGEGMLAPYKPRGFEQLECAGNSNSGIID